MESKFGEYELSIYNEIKTISENKVYIVVHSVTDKLYIKKVLGTEFLDIYRTLKTMKNKNRAEIIDYFFVDDKLIVIEELINGRTLENILINEGISEQEAIRIVVEICEGLSDIHNMDKVLIHRDIKPSNIMIMDDGSVKIIDFDAARFTNDENNRDTTLIGTTGYASPEQFGFAQTDNRSDIYSIGVLLNYLLIKKFPMQELASGAIGEIIKKSIQIDRNFRYENVESLKADLLILDLNYNTSNKTRDELFINKKETLNLDKKQKVNESKKKNINGVIKRSLEKVPGFRRKNILFGFLAAFWYLVAIVGFGEFFVEFNRDDLVVAIYMVIFPVMIFGKGFGLNKYIPVINGEKKWKKILAQIVYGFIITLIAGAAMGPTV